MTEFPPAAIESSARSGILVLPGGAAGLLVVALSRLKRLIVATHRTSPCHLVLVEVLGPSFHTSSGTGSGRLARRAMDSARANAAARLR
jgi:hypothetical protein